MSTSGITSSLLSQIFSSPSTENQFATDLNQLAQDAQSGNLSAAQDDFVTLSADALNGATSSTATTSASGITPSLLSSLASSPSSLNSFVSELNQLGTDLQNGDQTSAQEDMLSLDSMALNAASAASREFQRELEYGQLRDLEQSIGPDGADSSDCAGHECRRYVSRRHRHAGTGLGLTQFRRRQLLANDQCRSQFRFQQLIILQLDKPTPARLGFEQPQQLFVGPKFARLTPRRGGEWGRYGDRHDISQFFRSS